MDALEIEHRLTKVEQACHSLPAIQSSLEEMNLRFAKYEGKWGTITLIFAAFWAAFVAFKDEILRLIKG